MDTLWKDLSTSIHDLPFDHNQSHNQVDSLISADSPPSSSNTDPLDDNPLDSVMLKYISEMLMEEEDLDEKKQDNRLALQADPLISADSPPSSLNTDDPLDENPLDSIGLKYISEILMEEEDVSEKKQDNNLALQAAEKSFYEALLDTSSSSSPEPSLTQIGVSSYQELDGEDEVTRPRGRKNNHRDNGFEQERSRKQSAIAVDGDQEEQSDLFDEVLLKCESEEFQNRQKVTKKKQRETGQGFVDLCALLTQCAQAVSISDQTTASKLLKQIQQHASPSGDGPQRLAHYFAKALEIRLAGTGAPVHVPFPNNKTPAAVLLRGYQAYILASPFHKMSHFSANKTIMKLSKQATTIHVIDFGIHYGFQWPSLIEQLSARSGGPPKLRITGIEFPQPGFRPSDRVEETGCRLKQYCNRFNIPFEFNGLAKQWETITLSDLKTQNNELIIVNSLFRFRSLLDDTISSISARDTVLNLIKSINPSVFIHGVVNCTHNTPFFLTRFREALFNYSSVFDMFDANLSREDERRMIFEREIYGRDIMNVIACEGSERVERPETYKKWQARNQRAGLQQLPLDMELVKKVRSLVRSGYHKDYSVDVDGQWMLQVWKGRVAYALSCWKPLNTSS